MKNNSNIEINLKPDDEYREKIEKLIIDNINPYTLLAQVGGNSITKVRR